MSPFEAVMLVCFGAAWPFSIYRSLTSRSTNGKSLAFMLVLLAGYVAGIMNKFATGMDPVVWLYVANFLMVGFDACLWMRNRRLEARAEQAHASAA